MTTPVFNIAQDATATFTAYAWLDNKVDTGTEVAEADVDLYCAAVWGNGVDEALIQINEVFQSARSIDGLDIGTGSDATAYLGFGKTDAGDQDLLQFYVGTPGTAANLRWAMRHAADEDISWRRYNGSGAFQDTPFAIDFATGAITILSLTVSTAVTLPNNSITNAFLRDSGALSVIGRSANSTGDPADISATPASGAVLRESGSVLGFGTVATAGIGDAQVTDAKLANMGARSVKGRAANSAGVPADIAGAGADSVMTDDGTTLAFRTRTSLGIPQIFTARLASQHDISSTTATEVTGLQVSLTAGTWVLEYYLQCNSNATTTGVNFGFNYTGTGTLSNAVAWGVSNATTDVSTSIYDNTNSVAQLFMAFSTQTESTTAPNLGPSLGAATSAGAYLVRITVLLVATGSGDAELWHASEVAAQTSVLVDSCVIATKVG